MGYFMQKVKKIYSKCFFIMLFMFIFGANNTKRIEYENKICSSITINYFIW
jgi:hypothetical protein